MVEGRRLYIGSNVCSTSNGSNVKSSGAEREKDSAVLECGADKFLDITVVDCVRRLDSVPDPSDPDQSAVNAEPRREDGSGYMGVCDSEAEALVEPEREIRAEDCEDFAPALFREEAPCVSLLLGLGAMGRKP